MRRYGMFGLLAGIMFGLGLIVQVDAADIGGSQPVERVAGRIGYQAMETTAAYRGSIAVVDTADSTHADIVAIDKVYCGGFTAVAVWTRHTTASSTVVAQCLRYNTAGTLISMSEATLTGDATRTDGTNYLSTGVVAFDTIGAAYCRILFEAPSAGSIIPWAEAY